MQVNGGSVASQVALLLINTNVFFNEWVNNLIVNSNVVAGWQWHGGFCMPEWRGHVKQRELLDLVLNLAM